MVITVEEEVSFEKMYLAGWWKWANLDAGSTTGSICSTHLGCLVEPEEVQAGFIRILPDRLADTLLRVIKENIHPSTTVRSDCWNR